MNVCKINKTIFVLLLLFLGLTARTQPRLSKLISDGMVLQRDTKLNVWGWASPGERITVRFQNKSCETVTDADGKWQVSLLSFSAFFRRESLPFLYVQSPRFMKYNHLPSESSWAVLRESQFKALSEPNTAMAVAIDLGEWNDIHPDNKKDVGGRLALAAFKTAYGENLVSSGSLFQSAAVEGNKIVVSFTNTGSDKKFV